MSKFLKFIVHFFVVCTIVCVLGLALPPFFGVRTVIMDSSDKATNLPVGSVTYAIPVNWNLLQWVLLRLRLEYWRPAELPGGKHCKRCRSDHVHPGLHLSLPP